MKPPIFNRTERAHISSHYNNKIINPKNFLIERYELSKAVSHLKKDIGKVFRIKLITNRLEIKLNKFLKWKI